MLPFRLNLLAGCCAVVVACAVSFAVPAVAFTPQVRDVLTTADSDRLARIGRHIITGLDSIDSAKLLVEKRAIAGIFITDHNVKGKTIAQISAQIAKLQAIRAAQGLPPLIIAADQEGGSVSRLSPPLRRQPTLANVVAPPARKRIAVKKRNRKGRMIVTYRLAPPVPDTDADKKARVEAFAQVQVSGLKAMGVNLNFSPVVDLRTKIGHRNDGETRLTARAISDDVALVTKTASWYCNALVRQEVMCTLKHFPGLGRVANDTHKRQATLTATRDDLLIHDWAPYRALMQTPGITTMLGHVRLAAFDKTTPASYSDAVISGLIRKEWQHDGLLITDDFSMGAVTKANEGKAAAAVKSLNAGADLVLVSWGERDLAGILNGLLAADAKGLLDHKKLDVSVLRLARARIDATAK